jgi:hypothetical protein
MFRVLIIHHQDNYPGLITFCQTLTSIYSSYPETSLTVETCRISSDEDILNEKRFV